MRKERAQKPRGSQRAQKVEWVTGRGNQHRVKDAQRRRMLAVSRTRTRSRERSRTRRGHSASAHMRFRPNTQEVGKNYARARHVRAKSRTPRRRVERRQGRQYTPPRVHVRRDRGNRNSHVNEADFEAEERRMRHSTWDRKPKASRWGRTSSTQRGNYTVPREEGDDDAAVALARSFLEAVTTREKKETGPRRSGKDKEEQNIRTWALNPRNPALREIGPSTILKNIYQLQELKNPPAEVFFTLLAL